ncbi:hypothetical protein B0H19DRAFT_1233176 [Mycena capillaripes]|nr:hypothetical protein B0H19DRAFT_1233176 [Mycena capillaripes]
MPGSDSSSSHSSYNLQRGRACSNCRRKKIKCDGIRPCCGPCRLRPPRSGHPCLFAREDPLEYQTPAQMRETIERLKLRIEQLEHVKGHAPAEIHLHHPYESSGHESSDQDSSSRATTPESYVASQNIQEPALEIIKKLFTGSGYFFFDPLKFCSSVLLPLPFGHINRPSPALLSAVYLWGCVLSPILPDGENTFLLSALHHLPADIRGIAAQPKLILDTIQTEILLSLYYLHTALPVQGRYHAAAAASLALVVGLNQQHNPNEQDSFALGGQLLPPAADALEVAERVDAFWSVVIMNNYWAAAQGSPSPVPYGPSIGTPWPSGSQAGATITNFLSSKEKDGYSPVALLAKASILLERILAVRERTSGLDSTALNPLDARLHTFQSALPPLPGNRALFLAHALTDLAIIRLHAPHTHSSATAREKALTAAARITVNLEGMEVLSNVDPILGPVCMNVCMFYRDELAALRSGFHTPAAREEYSDIEQRFSTVMRAMEKFTHGSPSSSPIMRLKIWNNPEFSWLQFDRFRPNIASRRPY